jgi:hypothetical protein
LSYGLDYGQSFGQPFSLNNVLSFGLIPGLILGLSFGLSYWLLLGLFQGILQEQIDDQSRQILNQGVYRSALYSVIIGFLSTAIIGGIGFLNLLLTNIFGSMFYERDPEQGLIWLFAVSGGLLAWASSGGWAVLQHAIVRLLLARSHTFSWRAQAFLDEATSHILMRRVGGGYSFVHRRLLDYFADTYPSTVKEREKSPLERD